MARRQSRAPPDRPAYPCSATPRTHSDEQVAQIAASIREWGWTVPVLCDEAGGIIAGHGRVLAARQLGLLEIPVMTATGSSEAKKRAYLIADNKLALNADWDLDLLKLELSDLNESGFGDLLGFSDIELSALLAESAAGLTDPEAEWQGMPEFSQEDKTAFQQVVVHFPDQKAVHDFAALVKMQITPHTRFLWFPETVIERYADKKYKGDES